MAKPVFFDFGILPDTADARPRARGLFPVFSALSAGVFRVLSRDLYRGVLVEGDTLSALAGAQAAFLSGVPVYHVEAGLRTFDPENPYPEEAVRRAVAPMAAHHFCTTEDARENLLREGVSPLRITLSGNTVFDAMVRFSRCPLLFPKPEGVPFILVTAHRREATNEQLAAIFAAARALGERGYAVLIPLHKNPRVRYVAYRVLEDRPRGVDVREPLSPSVFYPLLREIDLIVTDSGGLSEEGALLGKRTLVVRDKTERTWEARTGRITVVPPDKNAIVSAVDQALSAPPPAGYCPKRSPSEIIAEKLLADAFVE